MTMNVSLTPALEKYVNGKVSTGRYGSASEVVREALRLLEDRDRLRDAQMSELRAALGKGLEELDVGRGEPLDMAAIKARGRKQLASRRRKS